MNRVTDENHENPSLRVVDIWDLLNTKECQPLHCDVF